MKQGQKNSSISDILSDKVWWCNRKRFLSYSKNYICTREKRADTSFKETRGRDKCKDRQAVYDAWVDNIIPSTDGRNRWNKITVSKRCNLPISDLTNQQVVIKESINKWGQKVFSAPRMIVTLTVHGMQEKLKSKGTIISVGTLMALKQFFINYATELEITFVFVNFV